MYQYVSQYVMNIHNLRIKQYVPICIQYVINLHNLRIKQYVQYVSHM